MKRFSLYPLLVAFLFAVSCNTSYKAESVQYSNYRAQKNTTGSESITSLVKPYSDSVSKLMDVVIGYNERQLETTKQANTLGYFMTDAYLEMAKQKIDPQVDAAFMNTGGVRLPDLPAGPITQGKIFELMPFDNLIVLLKIKGNQLKEYLDTLAADDDIIESVITMQIENKTTNNIVVGNKPLDPSADYTIAHSDYVAINTNLLKNVKRTTNGYLLRDALLDYVKSANGQNKKISVSNINRIVYVN
jgi:2',3'-cyclic-nucleotide 2'-phosphodiesterase (5'-nucleotidase family)